MSFQFRDKDVMRDSAKYFAQVQGGLTETCGVWEQGVVGFGVGAAGLQVRPSPGEGPSTTTGQLSWTISVVTALWSQVVVSVYHKGIIPGWISSDQRVFRFLKRLLLAFSWVLVR
ncbi:hypothetical protein QYF61_014739 [Mycteria americana]|uniref:Uncharacterized protein n=1 Tax=Mycteria americana TaxID=33587 RepID=A0AAN7NJF2_MYCAM|nr:hypothetical protein QYF61_014739 [Mycteria americana]